MSTSKLLTLTIADATDYVLCDRESLDETGELWLHTEVPLTGPALGAIVLPWLRPPGLVLLPIGPGWLLIEQDNLYAPRGERRAGIERLVRADNIADRELVGSVAQRSGRLALVPTISSTDPAWRALEGCRDGGCTFASSPGLYELWWITPVNARCRRTHVELDEYWMLLPVDEV